MYWVLFCTSKTVKMDIESHSDVGKNQPKERSQTTLGALLPGGDPQLHHRYCNKLATRRLSVSGVNISIANELHKSF